jgi:hypothetical protein
LHTLLALAVSGVERVVTVGRFAGFAGLLAATAVVNWLLWISVEASRRILGSIVAAALVCWAGWRIWQATLWRSVRVVVLPFVFAAVAAVTITWWAEAVRRYMVDGEVVNLAWIGAGVLAAAITLALVWITVCGQPLAVSLRSARHSANIAATKGLLVLATFAGALGAPGTLLGVGPIRWGWLTVGVFLLLGVATAVHLAARRRRLATDWRDDDRPDQQGVPDHDQSDGNHDVRAAIPPPVRPKLLHGGGRCVGRGRHPLAI